MACIAYWAGLGCMLRERSGDTMPFLAIDISDLLKLSYEPCLQRKRQCTAVVTIALSGPPCMHGKDNVHQMPLLAIDTL